MSSEDPGLRSCGHADRVDAGAVEARRLAGTCPAGNERVEAMRAERLRERPPRAAITGCAFLLLVGIGGIDYVTGPDLSFSIFYLVPISLVAWAVGREAGLLFSVIGAVIWLMADLGWETHASRSICYWNAAARLGFFAIVSVLLANRKAARDALEQTVRERTASLVDEIKQRELTEAQLRRIDRALRVVSDCNQCVVRSREESELLQGICRILVETGGFRLAWVGFAEQDGEKTVRPAAQVGFEQGYLESVKISWADTEKGRGPAGTAIRTGKPCVARDVPTDPRFAPWREEAAERGYTSCIALPLIAAGQTVGALNLYATDPNVFDEEGVRLLSELALDLGYGIRALRTQADRKQAEESLRHSEQRLRLHFEQAPLGVIEWDLEFKVARWNPGAAGIFGYSERETLGRHAAFIIAPDAREHVDKVWNELLARKGGKRSVNHNVTKDGRTILCEWYNTPLVEEQGKLIGVASFIQDITERKRLEQEFVQAQKMEAVGRLAGGVAHDFRNQLTVVKGFGEMLLRRSWVTEEGRDRVAEILKAAERSATLAEKLLTLSRQQLIRPEVVSLDELITSMAKSLARVIGEDIRLSVIPFSNLGRVEVDPAEFQHALANLVVNAKDAMPQGGRLTIEAANVELDEAYVQQHIGASVGPHVMVAVSDSGVGMNRETLEKVFEPFFTTKPVGQGTGLGLAMVYGFVKRSGGHVGVYSEPGQGTTFRLYLPRVSEVSQPQHEVPSPAVVEKGTGTILVVEDEEGVRRCVVQTLEESGYAVLEATGPAKGIALAERYEGQIDLLIADVVMPDMNGPDLAARVRAVRPGIRVLFISGYTGDGLAQRGLVEKEARLLAKPFGAQMLIQAVQEVLLSVKAPGL